MIIKDIMCKYLCNYNQMQAKNKYIIGKTNNLGRGRTVAFFFMSRHMLSHKYVTTFTPRESWRSHVWDINDI